MIKLILGKMHFCVNIAILYYSFYYTVVASHQCDKCLITRCDGIEDDLTHYIYVVVTLRF